MLLQHGQSHCSQIISPPIHQVLGGRPSNLLGLSATCCWLTATTLTGIESNWKFTHFSKILPIYQASPSPSFTPHHNNKQQLNKRATKLTPRLFNRSFVSPSTSNCPALTVLRKVQGRNLRHVLIFSFPLLFLQLERDATDGSALDTLHEMGGIAGDLLSNNFSGRFNGKNYASRNSVPARLVCSNGYVLEHRARVYEPYSVISC